MTYAVVIMPTARRQVAAACAWWTEHRPAAPGLLIDELDRAFARLSEAPHVGTAWPRRPGVRRVMLARVDFYVLYRVRPRAQRVEVLALWHVKRGRGPSVR